MQIEYENGLAKGYMKRRKRAGIIYACSVYLFCAYNLLLKYQVLHLAYNVQQIGYNLLMIVSLGCLCYSILARQNFKGLVMYNHNEVKAFTPWQKQLFVLPVVVSAIFIPLIILFYALLAAPCYLAIGKVSESNRNYDSYI